VLLFSRVNVASIHLWFVNFRHAVYLINLNTPCQHIKSRCNW